MAEIIIAGFGGQGVLVLGQVITYAGMLKKIRMCPGSHPTVPSSGEVPATVPWW